MLKPDSMSLLSTDNDSFEKISFTVCLQWIAWRAITMVALQTCTNVLSFCAKYCQVRFLFFIFTLRIQPPLIIGSFFLNSLVISRYYRSAIEVLSWCYRDAIKMLSYTNFCHFAASASNRSIESNFFLYFQNYILCASSGCNSYFSIEN